MPTDAERIKEKLDIVDVVGEYVQLKKAGRNFKALSPFRTEKTPSLIVSPDRQIFRDFGGEIGGDLITFTMEIENITFQEALQYLADKAGIQLTRNAPLTEEEKQKDKILSINHLTGQFYNYILTSHQVGKNALKYIVEERALPKKLVDAFSVGYAPDSHSLTNYLTKKKGFSTQDLEASGVVARYNNRVIDFFRNRIIFPIHDSRGNIIAFSGRALDNTTQPKYINTRETSVYKKSHSLYGIYQAKDSIRKEKKVIVTEGELDVLSPRKIGITNIVAAKGTALTEDHIRLLKRFAEKILFCFDQDPAGTQAQRRALELIEKHGLSASVIMLPGGKDPDDLVKTDPQKFKKAVKNETNIYDFIIDSAIKEYGTSSAEGKKKILDKSLPTISSIENEVIKEHYLKKLAQHIDTTLPSLQKELEKRQTPQKKQEISQRKKETVEEYLISLILQSKNLKKASQDVLDQLEEVPLLNSGIEKLLSHFSKSNKKDPTKNLPQELNAIFDEAYLRPITEFKTQIELEKEINKTVALVKKGAAKAKMEEVARQLKEEKDEKKQKKLANEYTRLAEVLK